MKRCKKCGEYKELLNEEGICVFCMHGPGGKTVEKKVSSDQRYATGKPLRSAAID